MKYIFILLLISSSLLAEYEAEKEKFKQKYNIEKMKIGGGAKDLKILNSIDTTTFQNYDFNETEQRKIFGIQKLDKKQIEPNKGSNNYKDALMIKNHIQSKKVQKEVKNAMNYIVDDKSFDWGKYTGKYRKSMDENIKQYSSNKSSAFKSSNCFLSKDERLIIVISSSIPKNVLHQYFIDLENVNTDVLFVVRGTLGGIEEIMPTVKYFNKLLLIDENGDVNDPKNYYKHNIVINPKIVQRFKVTHVPAVLYVKNYNPIAELNSKMTEDLSDSEEYWITYGDMAIESTLKNINIEAKSTGMKKLIANLHPSYFENKGK